MLTAEKKKAKFPLTINHHIRADTDWFMASSHAKLRNFTTESNTRNHAIWTLVRKPFPVPTWATHTHTWENFDIDQAGCLLCGAHHSCDAKTCACTQGEVNPTSPPVSPRYYS